MLKSFIAVTLLWCMGASGQAGEHHHAGHGHEANPTPANDVQGLALNDGERWMMDDHTRSVFERMAGRLAANASLASSEARIAQGEYLKKDIEDLIAGCRMTGAAHNALHQYLSAYIPAVTSLSETGAEGSARRVAELLDQYPDYFE